MLRSASDALFSRSGSPFRSARSSSSSGSSAVSPIFSTTGPSQASSAAESPREELFSSSLRPIALFSVTVSAEETSLSVSGFLTPPVSSQSRAASSGSGDPAGGCGRTLTRMNAEWPAQRSKRGHSVFPRAGLRLLEDFHDRGAFVAVPVFRGRVFFLFVFRAENRDGGLFQQVFEVY